MSEVLDRPVTICPPDPRLSQPMGYTAMSHKAPALIAAKFLPNTNPDWRVKTIPLQKFAAMITPKGTVRTVTTAQFMEMCDDARAD